MSVYIKVKDAKVQAAGPGKLAVRILSKDTILTTNYALASANPVWNSSFIGSIKQKLLAFQLIQQNNGQFVLLGEKEFNFANFRFTPEKQQHQTLQVNLKLDQFSSQAEQQRAAQQAGKHLINLDVFYTEKKNFIGPIQFYELAVYQTDSTIPYQQDPHANLKSKIIEGSKIKGSRLTGDRKEDSKNRFFSCFDDNTVDKQHTYEDKDGDYISTRAQIPIDTHKEPVKFFKGPCKTKNVFSCCDVGVEDQKFTIVEDYYRDT